MELRQPDIKGLGKAQKCLLKDLVSHPDRYIRQIYDEREVVIDISLVDDGPNDYSSVSSKMLVSLFGRDLFIDHTMIKCAHPLIEITTYRLSRSARELLNKLFHHAT